MGEIDIVGLVVCGVGLLVFIYGLVFWVLKGTSKKQKFIQKAREKGNVVTGYYKDRKVHFGISSETKNSTLKDDMIIVTYTYRVRNQDYEKSLSFEGNAAWFEEPKEIEIYYDSENPRKTVCPLEASKNSQQGHGCLMTIIATFLSMKIVLELLTRLLK